MSLYSRIANYNTNDEPIDVDIESDKITVQMNESYDIRNDDITEDLVVSYDNTNTSKTIHSQESFVHKINSNLYDLPPHKPNVPSSQSQMPKQTNSTDDIYSSFSKHIKTDSALFYENKFAHNHNAFNSDFTTHPPQKITNNLCDVLNDSTHIHIPLPIDATQTRMKLENVFMLNNSPPSSNTNSDTETSDQECENDHMKYLISEHAQNALSKRSMRFKKISYDEIERSLSKYYDKNNKFSNEVDILITFMRGQKHLYLQSSYVTQVKLYAIIIPALSITSIITVFTPFIQQYWWKIIFIMSGNAIATILITILKYMRFESACNTFTLIANHYEHYEHMLEMMNNKLVFIQDETEQNRIVLDKMREIEFKMSETKELCPIIIPVEVKNTYPIIFQTNIFSLIKKMDIHRKTLILQLKNIKNEIRYILFKWNSITQSNPTTHFTQESFQHISNNPQMQQEKIRLIYLMEQKELIKKDLIEYKDNYSQIDDLFTKEIKYAEFNKQWLRWIWCDSKKIEYHTYTNPIIKEHLELILSN